MKNLKPFIECVATWTELVIFLAFCIMLTAPKTSEITWYKAGTITASGEPFDPKGMTMAVKRFTDMGSFYKVSYRGKVVYVWANDLLPGKARADYDLSEGAFARLSDTKVGRIRARVERLND